MKKITYKITERDTGKLVKVTTDCAVMSRYADKCLPGSFYPIYEITTIVK